MSTISGTTVATSVTLGIAYTSPLTITSSGAIVTGGNDGVFGTAGYGSASVTNSGLISASLNGIDLQGGGTISNSGSIIGTANYGVALRKGGSVANNHGRIEGATGAIVTGGTAFVSNSGTILGTSKFGVDLTAGGSVENNGGLIEGLTAVRIGGASGAVSNSGTLLASGTLSLGVYLGAGGTVTNTSGLIEAACGVFIVGGGTLINHATIFGTATFGINYDYPATVYFQVGSIATAINTGTIVCQGDTENFAVELSGGGSVYNGSTGLIEAITGVKISQTAGTVTNLGTIFGTSSYRSIGVNLLAGGTIDNKGGLIEGAFGVFGTAGAVTVINAATVAGTANYGIELLAGGSVANNHGRIEGPSAIYVKSGTAFVSNSGTILGTSKFGIDLASGGGVENNGGLIEATTAVKIVGTAGAVINSGTLLGTSGVGIGVNLLAGGSVNNSGLVDGSSLGVYVNGAAGTVTNIGTIRATATDAIGVELRAGGIVTNNAGGLMRGATGAVLYGTAATLVNFGTIAGSTAVDVGGSNDRVIAGNGALFSGTVRSVTGQGNTLEIAGRQAAAVSVSGFGTLQFDGRSLGTVEGSYADLAGAITGFTVGNTIDVDGFVAISQTYTGSGATGALILTDNASNHATVGIQGSFSTGDFAISDDGHGGTNVTIPCFCRGTLILTEAGKVPVEELAIGDNVMTLSGSPRPIRWIGFGRELVTRGNKLARPVIVRQGALADGVPHRDLYLTHGHGLYLDRVLIPVENLINHRSILWDERARVVEYYHIELEDHDVLLAEGAPAESYYDAGNRALFHNARPGSTAGQARATFAPVLDSGAVVERVWAALLARAGGSIEVDTTGDPDLHLVIDGTRLDPAAAEDGVFAFALKAAPTDTLLLRSRCGVPSLLGLSRSDHWPLGVAIKWIALHHAGIATRFDYDQPQLREGGCYPPEEGFCCTDGEFALPPRFFRRLAGPLTLLVHTDPRFRMRYPFSAPLLARTA